MFHYFLGRTSGLFFSRLQKAEIGKRCVPLAGDSQARGPFMVSLKSLHSPASFAFFSVLESQFHFSPYPTYPVNVHQNGHAIIRITSANLGLSL